MQQDSSDSAGLSPRLVLLAAGRMRQTTAVLAASVAAWGFLTWIAVDMGHPLVQLTMPGVPEWSVLNIVAVFVMWAVMMAAMMLPSALPMILVFARLSEAGGEPARARVFIAAYLLVWTGFSAVATALQWILQAMDWVDPMIVSTSSLLSGALLLVAGVFLGIQAANWNEQRVEGIKAEAYLQRLRGNLRTDLQAIREAVAGGNPARRTQVLDAPAGLLVNPIRHAEQAMDF